MTDLTAVSLFAGVGGFDLALQRAGVRVTAAVEIDPKARAVLAHHFPDTVLFSDVQEVTGHELRATGFIPERGIITGGFPCQDLSVAGRREGLAGARSGLFWEIVRLLDDLAPRWVVLENVPGLLSSNGGRDMGTVVGALADLGYGWTYRVLDAQHFGVPQRRRRVFIVAGRHLGAPDLTGPASVLLEPESVRGHLASSHTAGQGTAAGTAPSLDGRHAVAEREREIFRLQSFGHYEADVVTSTMKSRDHKDATDLVVTA
jgi:DNA (cytosine-5)-methyltransferase 1